MQIIGIYPIPAELECPGVGFRVCGVASSQVIPMHSEGGNTPGSIQNRAWGGIQEWGVRRSEEEREGGLFVLTSIGHGFHKL